MYLIISVQYYSTWEANEMGVYDTKTVSLICSTQILHLYEHIFVNMYVMNIYCSSYTVKSLNRGLLM